LGLNLLKQSEIQMESTLNATLVLKNHKVNKLDLQENYPR